MESLCEKFVAVYDKVKLAFKISCFLFETRKEQNKLAIFLLLKLESLLNLVNEPMAALGWLFRNMFRHLFASLNFNAETNAWFVSF